MSRVQLALNVPDIDAAVDFYTKLFATEPNKRKPGYANFAIADPPLKLVLFEKAGADSRLNHLGVEVMSTEDVAAHQARLTGEGLDTVEENGTCCFAQQDKVWVDGPDGAWEIYTVLADADEFGQSSTKVDDAGDSLLLRVDPDRGVELLLTSPALPRRALAEYCGTAFLVAVVVGSGIAAERLSPGDLGLQLLENAAATAGGLAALIIAFGPVSGAHFNPVVSLVDSAFGGLARSDLPAYVAAQIAGAITGAIVANVMFELDAVTWSEKTRSAGGLWLGEAVATIGLLMVISGVVRAGRASVAPFAVGAYIGAAYFFTSSTSFANPAVTIGRAFTDSFAGIEPSSVPAFIAFQLVGAAMAALLIRTLYRTG